MKTGFFGVTTLATLALAGALAAPALAQVASGEPYMEARAALIAQGWRPDASYGARMANGKPLYHFPEIWCGPQICRAKWHDAQGHAQSIMLNRGFNQDHTVAGME
ncbi:hypothetical protein SAMN06265338_101664 [Rhodoblastus acidophilus]|uniref:Uncharacterized protein n=1 Tax=Rhodoblastus acidophilus TaxID=1074 RepID=A0A212QKI1_RHOAC|nr:hypothetical protein [Rhodoblastus acidophilus]PPQ39928.1 hypothetical protein CKO16_03755 [Rhodoblastus acidophilus]RAI23298.1 hypothetical protein CH337_03440 [Rhodoblastus acidophilus]SNB59747.1 hypothetical protein SAMN06265338_101664 [Rhodoblastus acidophilus]